MFKAKMAMLMVPALMVATALPVPAQDRDHRDHGNFNQGLRDRRDGGYYNGEHRPQYRREYQTQYNNGYYNHGDYRENQGGIGPGKGALIGGAGGAVLGALLGHGLGGALIGGAAGAGIGAIAGKAHQDHQRDQYGNYYPR